MLLCRILGLYAARDMTRLRVEYAYAGACAGGERTAFIGVLVAGELTARSGARLTRLAARTDSLRFRDDLQRCAVTTLLS